LSISHNMMLTMTGAYSRGGVQAYSRRVAEILSDYGSRRSLDLHGVSLQDSQWSSDQHPNPVRYASFGAAAGNRVEFVRLSAQAAWKARPRLAVVMHTCIAPPSFMLRAARMTGPYLLVLHGIEAWTRVNPAVRAAALGAWRIVATTWHTAHEFARANGIPEEKFVVIPLAVPDAAAANAAPARAGNGELRVLTAGRLASEDAYKGYDVLISGIARARELGAEVRLRIVGAGDDFGRLQAHAGNLGLSDGSVEFLGAVSDQQLRGELVECDVFALPSRGEGFGIVYLEAMSTARPCIAGNHGGPPEIIDDGRDGYLVEHGDTEQLASRLVTLCRQPELRREMGANAALKVQQRYLFSHMRDAWFKLLDQSSE
jgi:glycosyltransferase involved in cell wall biosynthesis